ncbi:GNAT family N-acetyltransferase [Sinorhizobium meliloti]|uniref:GNAT family N-acetyltransferase n=1 Tax=Rhizobium meliloti TaxID=382 RepID=UPI0002F1E7A0|nr:GNAT family N-acetyltransferase [Sinorhizobium meliloti]MDE3767769.1 GNAT family N-acetyltransferase [Sinorhizobium meliloti]MDE3779598.1 GNAT family N-acetyltransferase [Sinorhizobium meliloti]MDE3807223.1 GNAT family N-acetyltransferase [Sinorhizobium meliloti]RVH54495.1 GNAT family N-acetyltransferase [Sinorhizobium meliloti]RVL91986.1 GNAT family N-acetyltransferase [Sinorhizobium meliloti]
MPDVDIRVLTAGDTLAALPALAEILSDCVEGGASVGFMQPFSPNDAVHFWEGVAAAVGRSETVLLAAEVDGRMVGTVQLGVSTMPNQPHRADVRKLLVHRDARGLGLSRRLMDAAEAEAVRRGRRVLVLDTATGEPAEAIYERFGWTRAGIVPDYALMPDGRCCATTFFYKHLAT